MGLLCVATAAVLCVPAARTVAGESVPLINGDFRRGADAAGIPEGWSKYGGSANASSRWLSDKQGLLIDDQDPAAETGVQQQRAMSLREADPPAPQGGQPWLAVMQTNVGAAVADLEVEPSAQGALLAVAADKRVHLITLEGETVRRFETDGRIRNLHWWDRPQLLLTGCIDEKLIAFDQQGQRRWTFISEMDPAVLQARRSTGSVCMVVGCDDGTVLQLDQTGQVIAHGRIEGRPTHIIDPARGDHPLVVLATNTGTVAAFSLEDRPPTKPEPSVSRSPGR